MTVRPARPDDAEELTRLREVMLRAIGEDPDADGGSWRAECVRRVAVGLEDSIVAVVAERPTGGLAACAAATVYAMLPGPRNPTGLTAYLYSVVTDEDARRLGLARRCVVGVMEELAARGVNRVELHASDEGAPLYRDLGFTNPEWQAMTWRAGSDPLG
ncbi:GNAT family N-acetyltransferase [Motilibacter deserti]|nr:GNAT family N-acetyltransferase [Motilibacter deserti]